MAEGVGFIEEGRGHQHIERLPSPDQFRLTHPNVEGQLCRWLNYVPIKSMPAFRFILRFLPVFISFIRAISRWFHLEEGLQTIHPFVLQFGGLEVERPARHRRLDNREQGVELESILKLVKVEQFLSRSDQQYVKMRLHRESLRSEERRVGKECR